MSQPDKPRKLRESDKDFARFLRELNDPVVQYAAEEMLKAGGWVREADRPLDLAESRPPKPSKRKERQGRADRRQREVKELRAKLVARDRLLKKMTQPAQAKPSKPALISFSIPKDGIAHELIEKTAQVCGLPVESFLKELVTIGVLDRAERLDLLPPPAGYPRH